MQDNRYTPQSKRIGKFEFKGTKPLIRYEEDKEYYEIVKWYPNDYYGREKDFVYKKEQNVYKHPKSPYIKIHPSCFKHKEACYTVATFIYDSHEPCYDLKSVGNRIVKCVDNSQDMLDLHDVIAYGFIELEKTIEDEY